MKPPRARTTMLYRFARLVTRAVLGVYFKKLETIGASRVPASGPVILASNHPQSVTDALVLGICAGRTVHYLGNSGMFENRFKAWLLRNLSVIPVYRRSDVADAAYRNVEVFSACHSLLADGGVIGVFPEGVSAKRRRMQAFKTGTARIALESEQKGGWALGVRVVPVGLAFESSRRFRSRVLVSFGAPIEVATYRGLYEADPMEAVYRLTEALQAAIRQYVVSIERPELEDLVAEVEAVYKGELLGRADSTAPGESSFERAQRASREIARALDHFLENRPIVLWRIQQRLKGYRRKLETLRLQDESFRAHKRATVPGETARFAAFGGLGLPFALYGIVWNVLPYKATGWIARRYAADETRFHFLQLTVGAGVYILYYVPLGYIAYRLLGFAGSIIFAATLPPTGLFAYAYSRYMSRRRRMLRLAYLELTHKYAIQRLRQEREQLIADLDIAFDEYLERR